MFSSLLLLIVLSLKEAEKFVKIIMIKLLLVTDLIFCDNSKANGQIRLGFRGGDQCDLQEYAKNNFQMSVSLCLPPSNCKTQSIMGSQHDGYYTDTPINVFQASDNTDTIGTKQYKLQM